MKLNDASIRAAKPEGGTQKLRDGNGMYMHVMPSGSKIWRYDYKFRGKRKTLTLGAYPSLTLKAARVALFEAKGKLATGIDPSYEKQLAKYVGVDDTFASVAREWLKQHDCANSTRSEIQRNLEKDVFPIIGEHHIKMIGPRDVLNVARRIESRGAFDQAKRTCRNISQAMRYAVYTGLVNSDPCRDLMGAVRGNKKTKRYPAITNPEKFGKLLADIDTYSLNLVIALALRLAPHVVLRPSELREGRWSEIDFEEAVWNIPDARMKKERDHFVPLSRQSLEILETLKRITGRGELLFPSPVKRKQAISENTLNMALKRLGYGKVHCSHGFRSSFSTIANEKGVYSPDAIEAQLAHLDKDRVRAAYNRADHREQRFEMMQWWSDEIDVMRASLCLYLERDVQ